MENQFYLRLRKSDKRDAILRELLQNGPQSIDTLAEKTGASKNVVRWLPAWSKMFDNIVVVNNDGNIKATYIDAMPASPISVSIDANEYSDHSVSTNASMPTSNIVWPQMPPLCEKQDFFRKPSWYDTMRAMVMLGKHIALAGPPGVGKDTAVIQLAAEEGMPLVTVGGDAGFRRRDLVGSAQISNGSSYFEVAEYAAAAVNGWWVLLTEVNAADADALMYINAQLAAPYIVTINGKAYPVHKNFRIFITYNPGLIGTKPLPQSFKDRFFSIQVPFYNKSQLYRVLEANGMNAEMPYAEQIVEFGLKMWDAHERGQLKYQITTRRLIDAVTLLNNGIVDNVKSALTMAVLDAIDSSIERKNAEIVLRSVCNG
jgi:MoxR-like ATPase